MTREQWKERLPVIQAFVEGKRLQFRISNDWNDCPNPDFSAKCENYRIVPEPKWRAWKLNEVPLGSWLRMNCWHKDSAALITNRLELDSDEGAVVDVYSGGKHWRSDFLLNEAKHSTDGGKTWLPCGVLESQ